jgi:hypothetical protein
MGCWLWRLVGRLILIVHGALQGVKADGAVYQGKRGIWFEGRIEPNWKRVIVCG